MVRVSVRIDTPLRSSFRVAQVAGLLDVPLADRLQHELTASVPAIDESWTIGAIVGPSGSGKTTLAKAALGQIDEPQEWPADRALIDALGNANDRTIKQLARVLTGVGLGSVPTWLKPYGVLSGGERFRADLARTLLSATRPIVVIDEFTSSLDRTIAKTTSAAVARLFRRGIAGEKSKVRDRKSVLRAARLVAVTCHTDILPWLAPNWVVDLGSAEGPRLIRQPYPIPKLPLLVRRVPQSLWQSFAKHHYLTGGLAASATCYAAFWPCDGREQTTHRPVAFCAVAPSLGWKNARHIARLVTLPEFQGLGLGGKLLDEVARLHATKQERISITASHPAILAHCQASPHWHLTDLKKSGSTRQRYAGRKIRCSNGRAVAAFRYQQKNEG